MNPHVKRSLTALPRTRTFSFDEISSGFGGPTVVSGGQLYWLTLDARPVSIWMGRITGTECLIKVENSGGSANAILVSVDGGAMVGATPMGNNTHRLFTGLEDRQHTIVIGPGPSAYYQGLKTGANPIFTVTSVAPAIKTPATMITAGDFQANTVQGGYYHNYTQGSNTQTGTIPTTLLSRDSGNGNPGSSSSIRFTTSASNMIITANSKYAFISIDGGPHKRYSSYLGNLGATPKDYPTSGNTFDADGPYFSAFTASWTIALDGQSHTYNVWTGGLPNLHNVFSIGLDKPLLTLSGTAKKLDQFGDSLTVGLACTCGGEVEALQVAAQYGYCGSTYGYSGETIQQFATRLTAMLPYMTVTSADVAIIAQGRNGAATANPLSGADITAYTSIITQLLAKGYGKVLCRGIIPEVGNTWAGNNTSIQSIVTGLADARVVYVSVDAWQNNWTSSGDGTHPGDYGYTQWLTLANTSYSGLI